MAINMMTNCIVILKALTDIKGSSLFIGHQGYKDTLFKDYQQQQKHQCGLRDISNFDVVHSVMDGGWGFNLSHVDYAYRKKSTASSLSNKS